LEAAKAERAAVPVYTAVQSIQGKPQPSHFIELLGNARPQGVILQSISYSTASLPKDAIASVDVAGTATTRDVLLSFKQTVETLSGVRSVTLPLTALTKPTDIPFQ